MSDDLLSPPLGCRIIACRAVLVILSYCFTSFWYCLGTALAVAAAGSPDGLSDVISCVRFVVAVAGSKCLQPQICMHQHVCIWYLNGTNKYTADI